MNFKSNVLEICIYSNIYTCIYWEFIEINLFVIIIDLSMKSYCIYCIFIYWHLLYLLLFI